MTDTTSEQLPSGDAEIGTGEPYHPRLGDLAFDLGAGGRIGVVVALPREGAKTYKLRPPGGGREWSAPSDGSTLRTVPVPVTHVTLLKRDALYDHRAQRAVMRVQVHFEDGSNVESTLLLTPSELLMSQIQFERLIQQRERARGHER
ncbi:hypothetical protein [Streptomyces sp. I05A-00742]|uniref:hypothetical protein n=1 Tax=Streptomyces sp. I05A-00742 TaxID=2732853 RepID=UPI0014895D85|nr:hypothetical protein [Streptomyces sp. I05A-00742]